MPNTAFDRSPRADELVGHSTALEALKHRLVRLAVAPGTVLILGETGTGKELAARALHRASPRAHQPLVALNCAALPRDLVEAELFGSAAGAFTGARDRPGLFRAAHHGTLFLDEVGDLALSAQAALLRAIETGTVRPVGTEASVPVDVRLLCATHHDLKRRVESGAFRADLYHRISTLTVTVPPLRDRREDVPALARALAGPGVDRLTPAAWRALERHPWPGNVRELRNVLLRTLATTDGPVHPHHLDLDEAPTPAPRSGGRTLRSQIVELVQREVAAQGGNLRAAARVLGVSPTTLYRYLSLDG